MINASLLLPGTYSSAGIGKSTCYNMSSVKTLQSTIDAFVYQNPRGISPADCLGLEGSYAQSNAFYDGMQNFAVEFYKDVNADPVMYRKVVPVVNRRYRFFVDEFGTKQIAISSGNKKEVVAYDADPNRTDLYLRANVNDFLASVTALGTNGIVSARCCTWEEVTKAYRSNVVWSYSDSRAVRSCHSGTINVELNLILDNMSLVEEQEDEANYSGLYAGELVPVKVVYANKAFVYLIMRNNVDLLAADKSQDLAKIALWNAFKRVTCYSIEYILVAYDYPKDYKFPLSMFEAEGFGPLVTMGVTVSGNASRLSLIKKQAQKQKQQGALSFTDFKKKSKGKPNADMCYKQLAEINEIYSFACNYESVPSTVGLKKFKDKFKDGDQEVAYKIWWLSKYLDDLRWLLNEQRSIMLETDIDSEQFVEIVQREILSNSNNIDSEAAEDDAMLNPDDSDLLDRDVKEFPERVSLQAASGKWITVSLDVWSVWTRYGIVESLKDFNYVRTNSSSGTSEGGKSTEIKQKMQQTTLNLSEISNVPASLQDIRDISTLSSMMNGQIVSFAVATGSAEKGLRTKVVPYRLRSERIVGGRGFFYSDVFYTHYEDNSTKWLTSASKHQFIVSRVYRPSGERLMLANWAVEAFCNFDSEGRVNHSTFTVSFIGTCAMNQDSVVVNHFADWYSYEQHLLKVQAKAWLGQIVNAVSTEGTEMLLAANAPINLWYYPRVDQELTGKGLDGMCARKAQAHKQLDYRLTHMQRPLISRNVQSREDFMESLLLADNSVPTRINGSVQSYELKDDIVAKLWSLKDTPSADLKHPGVPDLFVEA